MCKHVTIIRKALLRCKEIMFLIFARKKTQSIRESRKQHEGKHPIRDSYHSYIPPLITINNDKP